MPTVLPVRARRLFEAADKKALANISLRQGAILPWLGLLKRSAADTPQAGGHASGRAGWLAACFSLRIPSTIVANSSVDWRPVNRRPFKNIVGVE